MDCFDVGHKATISKLIFLGTCFVPEHFLIVHVRLLVNINPDQDLCTMLKPSFQNPVATIYLRLERLQGRCLPLPGFTSYVIHQLSSYQGTVRASTV